jgi:hypothetical protein
MSLGVRSSPICPRCNSPNVRRAHYRGWDRLLAWGFVRPYRCRWCLARFYRSAFWQRRPGTTSILTIDHLLRTPFPE